MALPAEAVPSQVRYTYDGAGRVTKAQTVITGDNRWATTTSYGVGWKVTTPPTGATKTITYTDVRDQVTKLEEYKTSTTKVATTYTYDTAGRMSTLTDASGNQWTWSYDLRGRLVTTTDPDAGTTTRTYDNGDQLTTSTDALGNTTVYIRDALGRVVQTRNAITTGTLKASWTYDTLAKGQLTSSTSYDTNQNPFVTAVTGYTDSYLPTGQKLTVPASEGVLAGTYGISYTYTADDQLATASYDAVKTLPAQLLTYTYDSAGNLVDEGSKAPWGTVGLARYDSLGRLAALTVGNNFADTTQYIYEDGTGRLLRQSTVLETEETHADGSARFAQDLTYTYDDAGNTVSVSDAGEGRATDTQCFKYDGLQRLTNAWTPAGACTSTVPTSWAAIGGPAPYWQDYTLDDLGRRTSLVTHAAAGNTTTTYGYPATGQDQPHTLTSTTTTGPGGTSTASYSYDDAGNTITRPSSTGATQTLTWDTNGKLAQVATGATVNGTYLYDASGARLLKREGGTTTIYLPGGQELSATGTATTTRRYYTFNGQVVGVRTAWGQYDLVPLVSNSQGTATLQIKNTLAARSGSPEGTETTLATIRRQDPYGNTRGTTATTWNGLHGFLDKPVDTTGLIQIGARYYDATVGRFISVDPVLQPGKPQSLTGYTYTGNNPITFSDPTGLFSWGKAWGQVTGFVKKHQATIVGAVVGGVVGAGCLALTAGVGSIGCAAIAGAVGGAATNLWRTKVQKTSKFSWSSLAKETAIGAASGAIGGTLGVAASGIIGGGARAGLSAVTRDLASTTRMGTAAASTVRTAATRAASTTQSAAANLRAVFRPSAARACSFAGSTPVLLADGTHKPIDQIAPGDKVTATDPEDKTQAGEPVTKVFVHTDTLYTLGIDGTDLTTTEDHPFWSVTDHKFERADQLTTGEKVLTATGTTATITTPLDPTTAHTARAYNLEIQTGLLQVSLTLAVRCFRPLRPPRRSSQTRPVSGDPAAPDGGDGGRCARSSARSPSAAGRGSASGAGPGRSSAAARRTTPSPRCRRLPRPAPSILAARIRSMR